MEEEMLARLEHIRELVLKSKGEWMEYFKSGDRGRLENIRGIQEDLFTKTHETQELARKINDMESREVLHEIGGNITVIQSGLNLVDGGVEKYRALLLANHDAADELIRDCGRGFDPAERDLHREIEEAVRGLRVPVELRLESLPKIAEIDGVQFKRMVHTLVNNAEQHLVENKVEGPRITISGSGENGEFVLHIGDNGRGMGDRISKKFYELGTTNRDHLGGTGMGGFIARKAVERHGGTISHQTGPEGTRFEIRMPVRRRELKK